MEKSLNIKELDEITDLAGLAIYTNRVIGGVRFLKMRQLCIDNGEDVSEKDHLYGIGETLIALMKNEVAENSLVKCGAKKYLEKGIVDECKSIGLMTLGSGAEALVGRARLYESLRNSKRGTCAFVLLRTDEQDINHYDLLISNGFGKVYSSKSNGIDLKQLPDIEMCMHYLIEYEFKIVLDKINHEIKRQCNLAAIRAMGMRAGAIVEVVKLHGYPKVKKIKVNKIDEEGGVYFEMLLSGVVEAKRPKKYMDARMLA